MLTPKDLEFVLDTARRAGQAVMEVYERDVAEQVELKADHSPLTEADKRSNALIIEALRERFPKIPILSEETKQVPYEERRHWSMYWLVDPLDGTKEFIKKNGEFTINIALLQEGMPVVGVVYAPAQGRLWYGLHQLGAYAVQADGSVRRLQRGSNWRQLNHVRVVASRSHLDENTLQFVDALRQQGKQVDFVSSGSSIKFCLVAEGQADVYPRFGPTMEWDTAAGQVIVELTGGTVSDWQSGQRLQYNKENLLNPFFIVEYPAGN
ncbi:MAG: 3'(2'),5'-bisphosphate nucleotidase CysQ [Chitinophagales bacterium]|nr:3'(2'),5'-bisphosphate nucleotidase CysQ [Chitinophagales bacterium]